MPSLAIAVIGAGAMGRQHAAVIEGSAHGHLCAVVDPGEAGHALADERDVPTFANHREMLERVRPEAAIIANPNALHVSTALDCLAAGVATLLEKPVGIDLQEVTTLIEALEHSRAPLLVGHHRRHNPLIERARELLDGGLLGEPTNVTALWQLRKPEAYYAPAWRRTPGNGMLHTNLIHDLDLLRHLCGEVAEVQAMTRDSRRGLPYADVVSVNMRFVSGALGTLSASDTATAPWSWELTSGENPAYPLQPDQPCYLLAGSQGALTLPQLRHWRYAGTPHWHAPLLHERSTAAPGDALARQLEHFIDVAHGVAAPRVSALDAGRTLALVDAVARAADSGQCVTPTALGDA